MSKLSGHAGTRDEDEKKPYKNTIDDWIRVHNGYKANVNFKIKTTTKEMAERNQAKTRREDWTKLLS